MVLCSTVHRCKNLSSYIAENFSASLTDEDVRNLFDKLVKKRGSISKAVKECGIARKTPYLWETANTIPFTFTQQSKSELGFNLLAAINSGRLKVYAGDGSAEEQEFWFEVERAKSQYRPSQTMNFYVDPAQGHDDFLMSLALLVEAANQYEPRGARGSIS